jgi:hypothetical protein
METVVMTTKILTAKEYLKQIGLTPDNSIYTGALLNGIAELMEGFAHQDAEARTPSEEDGRRKIPYPAEANLKQFYQNIGFIRGWRAAIKECRKKSKIG